MMVSEHGAASHGRADVDGVASKPVRNASIDWMRAASIWYIVGFWHLFGYVPTAPWSPERAAVFYRITTMILALFVLISGYLLGRAKVELTGPGLWSFYRKRLIRVYPPYLLALIVFAAGGILGASPVKAAVLVSMVSPPSPVTLWFVTMIVLFYLVAPFLIAAMHRPVILVGAVTLAWLVLSAVWWTVGALDVRLLMYLPVFVAGLLLARYPVAPRPPLLVALAVLTACAYAISLRAPVPADRSIWLAPVAFFGSLFVFLTMNERLPENRIVSLLSGGSFFLYLFHRPIYTVLIKVAALAGIEGWAARLAVLYVVGFPAAVAFGIVAQRLYDAGVAKLYAGPLASGPDRS